MEDNYNYVNISGAATTVISNPVGVAGGKLIRIVVNNPIASGTITVYDNGAASGNKVATITLPATVNAIGGSLDYGCSLTKGLTVVTTGTGLDVTVVYK